MTWTTVALIILAWCLVSVVVGFAFAYFFGGMNRIHPGELDPGRLQRFSADQQQKPEKVSRRYAKRRVKARAKAGAPYRPLVAGGAPGPPLDDQ